jgi:hypothetical protein
LAFDSFFFYNEFKLNFSANGYAWNLAKVTVMASRPTMLNVTLHKPRAADTQCTIVSFIQLILVNTIGL